MSLEPVSLGQGRTHCPGLSADERGVVMGRRLALFFPDVARAVGFFRAYSREVSLDEILRSLEIQETVSERGGREMMVRFEVQGSFAADRAAQAARLHRGRAFTGTEQHFVPFRDRKSPLGSDLSGPEDLVQDVVDLVLYGEAGPDRRKLGRKIQLRDLILGLSPRPLSEAEKTSETHDALVVRCEQGLSKMLCRYLWSRQVRARVTSAVSARKSLFSGKPREIQLVSCDGLPRHVAQLLALTPGMKVFVPTQKHLLVEWGFRHPIALESCGAAFTDDETVLFYGSVDASDPRATGRTERLVVEEDAVDIRDLVDVTVRGKDGIIPPPVDVKATGIESLDVELKLARLPRSQSSTTALLIDLDRLRWFQKLVYLLPAAILRTYEAVLTEQHIIVINRRGVHGIPFGAPMTEIYPQIFCPVGMSLLPRVDYDLLREHLQIRPDQNLTFFPEDAPPFAIPIAELKPLSRAVVAPERAKASIIEIASRTIAEELAMPTISHKRQGAFSLWRGTKIDPPLEEAKALPPPAATSPEQLQPRNTPRELPPPRPIRPAPAPVPQATTTTTTTTTTTPPAPNPPDGEGEAR
ncbi:MAG: hypothetical protein Q8O67_14110 [Deltaproteobacteria bacterium]|nr:hypothetical protein [Deltaproteobacteria bacterium]